MRALILVVASLLAVYVYIAVRCPALIIPVVVAGVVVTVAGYVIGVRDMKRYPPE